MESFFLSETAKYLWLLHSNASSLAGAYVLSTEGHLLPPQPWPPADRATAAAGAESHASAPRAAPAGGWLQPPARPQTPVACKRACTAGDVAASLASMRGAYPLLRPTQGAADLLRQRSCRACAVVTEAVGALGAGARPLLTPSAPARAPSTLQMQRALPWSQPA